MWTARSMSKVPLVSGSHEGPGFSETPVGALGVTCLVSVINNKRTQKPNQNKKYNQYLLGEVVRDCLNYRPSPGHGVVAGRRRAAVTGTCAAPPAAGTAGT